MSAQATDSNGHVSRAFRPGVTQTVAAGAASAQSSAFAATTTHVRVIQTTSAGNAAIRFGKNPTAVSTDIFLGYNVPEIFAVNPGDKLAAIQFSAAGSVQITELQ